MEYASREVLLKKGNVCVIRKPEVKDAAQVLQYRKDTSSETPYLVQEPEEIQMTVEEQAEALRENNESPGSLRLLAEADGQTAGIALLIPKRDRSRLRHRCEVGVTVRRAFWGMGIGMALMEEILETAEMAGYEQAELEVVSTNIPAVRLYKKLGFETMGTIPHALKYPDGTYADFLLMVKDLT